MVLAPLWIAGCAFYQGAGDRFQFKEPLHQGRLSLKVYTEPTQSLTADFELRGDARSGSLDLFTPLGNTAARIRWTPLDAWLQTLGDPQHFESLDTLTQRVTGTSLPIVCMFEWLKAIDCNAPGWQVNLQDAASGRFSARRFAPEVPAELKIILEP